ncbi:MAG: TetR/AcrR family transcriptional regulator [Actinomycetota bacterium]
MTAREAATTREALLDVAQRLYEADGVEGMSFRSIASAYGCSSTMPYSYFDSKGDLIDRLRVRAYQWIQGVLAMAASSTEDPIEALQNLSAAYVRAGIERPRMYELLYVASGTADEAEPELVEAKLAALNVCRDVIAAAADSAGVELVADPDTTAHLFWVAAHGLVSLELGGFLVVGRTIDQLMPALFSTMSVGMTARPERQGEH